MSWDLATFASLSQASNAQAITNIYSAQLARAPSAAEIASWQAQMAAGLPLDQVLHEVMQSAEWAQQHAPWPARIDPAVQPIVMAGQMVTFGGLEFYPDPDGNARAYLPGTLQQTGASYGRYGPDGWWFGTGRNESNSIGSFIGSTAQDLAPVVAMVGAGVGLAAALGATAAGTVAATTAAGTVPANGFGVVDMAAANGFDGVSFGVVDMAAANAAGAAAGGAAGAAAAAGGGLSLASLGSASGLKSLLGGSAGIKSLLGIGAPAAAAAAAPGAQGAPGAAPIAAQRTLSFPLILGAGLLLALALN